MQYLKRQNKKIKKKCKTSVLGMYSIFASYNIDITMLHTLTVIM